MSIVYAPKFGGINSGSARYPGIVQDETIKATELHIREAQQLKLAAEDMLSIVNIDGASSCLLLALNRDYEIDFASLSLTDLPDHPVDIDAFDSVEFLHVLAQSDLKPSTLAAKRLFDENTEAGERFSLKCTSAITLWLIFPLASNAIEVGGGGSLRIEHSPATPCTNSLPEPIGTVRDEFRVARASATAYSVKKGEYIQIIDVEGRQCSDFMAMRSDSLAQGEERYIDSTVTRSMVGGAYPQPGLYDKFFDQDMQPLLKVVQDTVGRHDTFALACTARGYEERGYPGHINCSDNISNAYKKYGIKSRAAWPAINFFFNSQISIHDNQLTSDESWSRPGDYVVMQALTDLVCVSTACPDDIDPINGWNPTEIHVRIYTEDSQIPRAIAYRPFVESRANMTTESAFYPKTSQLTQSYQVARDVWLPTRYDSTTAIEEYWACSQAVTIQDMSSLRKYDVSGPDAEKLLHKCMTRDVSKLSVNRGIYTLICTETGMVIDDGTLFRLAPELFRWCCGSEESARQLKTIAVEDNLKVWIKAMWSAMPNLAIQGPKSRELLSHLVFTQPTQPSLQNLKWFGCTIARLHDRNGPAFMLTRSGFTGELGYEIFCDQNGAEQIWDALMSAGKGFDITPMGSEALEIKRIEAGLMVAGAEITPDVDAHEAGLDFAVDLKKTEFIGQAALKRNSQAPRKLLVGLQIIGNEVPLHGAAIYLGKHQVGVVTSATRSPELQKTIALARLSIEHSEVDTSVEIGCLDGHIKRLTATVCSFPFVDPKRERARA